MKKIFWSVVIIFAFITMIANEISAQNQSKKVVRKPVAKQGASSSSGAKKVVRKASSSSAGRKRAATGGSGSSGAVRSGSTRRSASPGKVATKRLNLSADTAARKNDEEKCRNSFVQCMDAQIKDIIDKYTYLYDDSAVQAVVEVGDPLRCVFYDRHNDALKTEMGVVADCENTMKEAVLTNFASANTNMTAMQAHFSKYIHSITCNAGESNIVFNVDSAEVDNLTKQNAWVDATQYSGKGSVSNNYAVFRDACKRKFAIEGASDLPAYKELVRSECIGRDVNELYFAYNYYCDLQKSSLKSSIGLNTNYCALAGEKVVSDENAANLKNDEAIRREIANVFATTSSSEYYKAALKRLDAGELKMINFTNSELYKQRIDGLGLEALKSYDISSLLRIQTKCSSGLKFNATIGMCQKYDSDLGAYVDAGLSNATLVNVKDNSKENNDKCPTPYVAATEGVAATGSDTYDASSKKCMRCSTGTVWRADARKCQVTGKKDILAAAVEEDEKDARSIYSDLGIARDSSLFSINVVPPLGSGTVYPANLFEAASRYCFDGKQKSIIGVSAKLKEQYKTFNNVKKTLSSCKEDYYDDLERYYLAGYWPKANAEPKDGKYQDTDYEERDFLSAKRSCSMYEQNLISVRDNNYANFDTQIKNYLEDALAGIIKSKVKDTKVIADVANTLVKDDAKRTLDGIKNESDIALAKLANTAAVEKMRAASAKKEAEDTEKYLKTISKLQESILKLHEVAMVQACGDKLLGLARTFAAPQSAMSSDVMISEMRKRTIKVNSTGSISDEGSSTAGYQTFVCMDIPSVVNSAQFKNIEKIAFGTKRAATSLKEVTSAGDISGKLETGVYKIEVAAGGGGGGAGNQYWYGGGAGGAGHRDDIWLFVLTPGDYSGKAGGGGGGGGHDFWAKYANSGNDGGTSTFTFAGREYESAGGKKGGGGYGWSDGGHGAGGACGGNCNGGGGGGGGNNDSGGSGGGSGWIKVYKY